MPLEPERTTTESPDAGLDRILMDMAQILAHRIRSLVASIEGFTDLLADTLGTHEQRDLALRILEGAARIEHVLADLQLFSRPLEPVAVPVRPEAVVTDLQLMLEAGEIARVAVRIGCVDHRIWADSYLLRQALLVLVQNALEANDGRGEVRIEVVPGDAGGLDFRVWNEGFIDLPDAGTRVFLPFFTTKARNLGVGLTIAERIAEVHGGAVRLHANDPEAGTCFCLSMPRGEPPSETGL